jgi:methionyl aminopeptidase
MPRDAHGHLIPGRLSDTRTVPSGIPRPEYVGRTGPARSTGTDRYDADGIRRIREAGRIAAGALEAARQAVRPGVTGDDLDGIVHEYLVAHDAYPSTLGYRGFPKSCCVSINEVVCHGIPDDTVLAQGDIVNVDVTAFKDGMHGDLDATFPVGRVSDDALALIDAAREALRRGILAVAPGRPVNVIGRAIESYARRHGYGVVRDFTGHGVGEAFHSGLVIPHYDAAPAFDTRMEVGMVFTIEPMLTLGTPESPGTALWDEWDDGWTITTRDRSLTAQFEHTLVVTEGGAEILTLP